MTDTLFGTWLEETRKLQTEVYGMDYSTVGTDTPEHIQNLIKSVLMNMVAIDDEMAEMRQAISWKPWQQDEPYADTTELLNEAVDLLHFVANILAVAGATTAQLDAAYSAKMEKNRRRQAEGYRVKAAGVKCLECKRGLDDVEPSAVDPNYCKNCRG